MNRRCLNVVSAFVIGLLTPAWRTAAEPPPASAPVPSVAVGPLTREAFLSGISRDLQGHFNFEGELDLELLRPWSPPPQVAARWDVTVIEFPSIASSAMMLRCRIVADGQVAAEPTLVVRAALWREAWAARVPLAMNAAFDPAQLETRRVDMFRDREALPTAVGDRSYVLARTVSVGRLLTWRDIMRRPLVHKGEMVEVSAVDGALTITMKALAMESGAQGDRVTVRNPDSRRDFAAIVTDENRVQVRF